MVITALVLSVRLIQKDGSVKVDGMIVEDTIAT